MKSTEQPEATASIITHFSSIPDPRIERGKKHQLIDIFFMTLCAVISGADNWVSVAVSTANPKLNGSPKY